MLMYILMVSYSGSSYTNDFFDLSGVYFNSTSQSSSSAVDLDELDKRYLLKSGGDISNNLIINGSLDVKTNITLPDIGDVEDTIQGKQDELTEGTNISIVDNEVSCDLTAGTNIDITDGVISTTGLQNELTGGTNISILGDVVSCDLTGSTNIDITGGVISTTGLQNELTGGTNISILGDVVSCDLTGSTNIDITGGVISTTGLQNELRGGTNISIVNDIVSCDLVGSTNIEITDGVISTTGLQNELTGGTNISIVDNVVSCDLTGSTNIDITDGVISTTGLATTEALYDKQDEIGAYTDLTCKTLTTQGISVNGSRDIADPTLSDGVIELNEIQVWVDNVNIMVQPTTSPVGYFADLDNKEVPIEARFEDETLLSVDVYMYNNILEGRLAASGLASAMIVKELPLTSINDIQSIVLYNRGFFKKYEH